MVPDDESREDRKDDQPCLHGRPTAIGMRSKVTEVAASLNGDYGCAIQGGALRCWGDNFVGQLGDGLDTQRDEPVRGPDPKGARPYARIRALRVVLCRRPMSVTVVLP
jgi:hypothetical protein